jgi:ribosome-associated toxin RatA of RatAB toxin-antitoxin module
VEQPRPHRHGLPRLGKRAYSRAVTLLALLWVLGADDLSARLDAGEIIVSSEAVPGSDVPRAKMKAVIDAPPHKVWAIVEKCGDYSKTMPRIAASKELWRDGGTVVCEVTVDMPFPLTNLTSRTQATLTVEPGVRYERRWKLLSGDYRVNEGYWRLEPFAGDPERTLASYELYADPKIAVPQSFINSAQQKSLPKSVLGLREQTARK